MPQKCACLWRNGSSVCKGPSMRRDPLGVWRVQVYLTNSMVITRFFLNKLHELWPECVRPGLMNGTLSSKEESHGSEACSLNSTISLILWHLASSTRAYSVIDSRDEMGKFLYREAKSLHRTVHDVLIILKLSVTIELMRRSCQGFMGKCCMGVLTAESSAWQDTGPSRHSPPKWLPKGLCPHKWGCVAAHSQERTK